MSVRKTVIVLGFAFIGWMLCAATMGVGMSVTSINNALIVHAILAPIFFAIVSYIYFTQFNYTSPITTATIFIALVVIMDFFVVALVINRSLDMFTSLIGTWIPFLLIFFSTFFTGLFVQRKTGSKPT
jgi:hypothetical protein